MLRVQIPIRAVLFAVICLSGVIHLIQVNSLWGNAGNDTLPVVPANSPVSIELDDPSKTSTLLPSQPTTSETKIIAVADIKFKDVAALWYHQLTKLGYTTQFMKLSVPTLPWPVHVINIFKSSKGCVSTCSATTFRSP